MDWLRLNYNFKSIDVCIIELPLGTLYAHCLRITVQRLHKGGLLIQVCTGIIESFARDVNDI